MERKTNLNLNLNNVIHRYNTNSKMSVEISFRGISITCEYVR